VESIVDNLVLSQRNVLLGASNLGSAHVHGNGLDGAALVLRKLGKTAVCAFLAVSVGNSFYRAAIQIVQQCDVAVPLPEAFSSMPILGIGSSAFLAFPRLTALLRMCQVSSQQVFRIPWAPSTV
jgi:hypothetical protein